LNLGLSIFIAAKQSSFVTNLEKAKIPRSGRQSADNLRDPANLQLRQNYAASNPFHPVSIFFIATRLGPALLTIEKHSLAALG